MTAILLLTYSEHSDNAGHTSVYQKWKPTK